MGDNYKGFFYNDNDEPKYYEGGAHFKYIDLYEKLENLVKKEEENYKSIEVKSEKNIKINNRLVLKNQFDMTRNIKSIFINNGSPDKFNNYYKKKINSKLKIRCFGDNDLHKFNLHKRIQNEQNLTLPKIKIKDLDNSQNTNNNSINKIYLNNKKKIYIMKKENHEFSNDTINKISQSNKSIFEDNKKSYLEKKKKLYLKMSPCSKLFNMNKGKILNSNLTQLNTTIKYLKLPKKNKIKY
jgi:hypothetical protein